MHQVLAIPELVYMICSEISPWSGELAVLARTARTFHDPALDHLWRLQSTLTHLLKCMPPDLWNQSVDDETLSSLELVRPVLPADWDRPAQYLRRVKRFAPSCNNLPPRETFELLAASMDPLFPNLHTLDWLYMDSVQFPFIEAFMRPTIRSLSIHLPATIFSLALVPTFASKCPHLTSVDIHHFDPGEITHGAHICAAISLFVRGLQRIERLDISDLDQAAFELLANVPRLIALRIQRLTMHQFTFTPSPTSDDTRFFHLLHLELRTRLLDVATSVIAFLRSPGLTELTIVCASSSPHWSLIAALYQAVRDACLPSPLLYLTIEIYDTDGEDIAEGATVKHSALRKLTDFRSLTYLSLRIPGGFDLDDTTAGLLAHSWPNLRAMCFAPDDVVDRERRTTLAALAVFGQMCPKLEWMAIELNALEVPITEGDRTPQKNLKTLYVRHSPIQDPQAVAGFLSAIFPRLSVTSTGRIITTDEDDRPAEAGGSQQFRDRWQRVTEALQQHAEQRGDTQF
ncbi:hypothetical protein C8R47DRAFT_1317178 [Mycena vitilis]|nr:hypothetical protein C8R47DRAFT_1317178 [Mycena vitilis]